MDNYPGSSLHQIGPYIGRIRPSLSRQLIRQYSNEGDWIWDPFCGSGTIPLECRLLKRNVVAADINPYACILTRAKLHAPITEVSCISKIMIITRYLDSLKEDVKCIEIPDWVNKFFQHQTLIETQALMTDFLKTKNYFLAACLLGILHHQRPGFLSYPASHLVPYLRNNLFPIAEYPDYYSYRDPVPRLIAKITRVLKYPPPPISTHFFVKQQSALLKYLPDESINVIITSPPYMDALDYARDNRLRLWFLGVDDYKIIKEKEIRRVNDFKDNMLKFLKIAERVLKWQGLLVMIIGDITHFKNNYDLSDILCKLIDDDLLAFYLEDKWNEEIPNIRRSRRNGRATKRETILVFKKARR